MSLAAAPLTNFATGCVPDPEGYELAIRGRLVSHITRFFICGNVINSSIVCRCGRPGGVELCFANTVAGVILTFVFCGKKTVKCRGYRCGIHCGHSLVVRPSPLLTRNG